MTIAMGLRSYLGRHHIDYEEIPHALTMCASDSAMAAHIDLGDVAKGVLMRTMRGYMLAVIPASRRIDLKDLRDWLGNEATLAGEEEVERMFADCEAGAIPPLGEPYDLEMVVDETLLDMPEIYFEGGDHKTLVHLKGDDWMKLISKMPHRMISH